MSTRSTENRSLFHGELFDVVVIGTGFGGLGAALTAAEAGRSVLVLERVGYPGGCAGTFTRNGRAYAAGATLTSGLAAGQLFRRWIDRYSMPLEIDALDPVLEFLTPTETFTVHGDRREFVESWVDLAPERRASIRAFFAEVGRIGDLLWPLLDDPSLLPPIDFSNVGRHLRSAPRLIGLARFVARPASAFLERFGLADFLPLRRFLDATCRITVQCSIDEAEALPAIAAWDYYWRGAAHIRGGIGALADGIVDAVRSCGGRVEFFTEAVAAVPKDGTWTITTRRGDVRAKSVIANIFPDVAEKMTRLDAPKNWRARAGAVAESWGAAMLYASIKSDAALPSRARHFQILADPEAPAPEGNLFFVSVLEDGGRHPSEGPTLTVSTHVPMAKVNAMTPEQKSDYFAIVHDRLRSGLAKNLPDWSALIDDVETASPRTFARFTARPGGAVGGIPRRAGISAWKGLAPRPFARGFWLVGDSAFPGQSALACAVGGARVAQLAVR